MNLYLVYVSKCGRYVAIYSDFFTHYDVSVNKRGRTPSYEKLEKEWTYLGEL